MLLATIVMALREIARNTMRSLLTILGVVIGVGAVIALVTIGDGATQKVTASLESLGNNLLLISPHPDSRFVNTSNASKPFTEADAAAIAREITGLEHVAPTASRSMQVLTGN